MFFLFTTVYSCPQKKTGGAAAPSAPPVPAPLIKNILICVPKMNGSLEGLEWHEGE